MPSVEGIEDEVYNPLKWSYDSLQGNNTKSCFLYCSLFPKDFSIELVLHWRAEGLIDEQQNYVDSSPNSISELFVFLTVSCPNSWKWLKHFDILKPSYDWSSRPMSLVNVEDEGGHLWTMADVEGRRHMGKTAHVKGRRHMWATPMDTVDDKGHKLLEACFGNPIGGKGTFGAPNTRIVAQSTLDYWNNKLFVRVAVLFCWLVNFIYYVFLRNIIVVLQFDLSYKLVRVVGATWTILGAFMSKYLISMEIAKSEEDRPTKYFVRTYERFIMGADSNELKFCVCMPWDTYVLRTPKPLDGEWMETVD
nr:putative disease resistance protein [Quercus suber]